MPEEETRRRGITRRDFLKAVGAAGVATALEPISNVVEAWKVGPDVEKPPILPPGALYHILPEEEKIKLMRD